MDVTHNTTEAQAVADIVERLHGADVISISDPRGIAPAVPVLLTPKGLLLTSLKKTLDEYLPRPERRQGTATLLDLDSFVDHVNRFKDGDSVVFADNRWQAPEPAANDREKQERDRLPNKGWTTPKLLALLDYHEACNVRLDGGDLVPVQQESGEAPLPRFGQHRAAYEFPLSDEWMAWMEMNGQQMLQGDFAAFLEERALDLAPPPTLDGTFNGQAPDLPETASESERKRAEFMEALRTMTARLKATWAGPEKMMDLSRNLKITEHNRVEAASNIANGTGALVYVSEHTDEKGETVQVPGLFLISIPVFRGGPSYLIPVRLRYRAKGTVVWFYDTYRHDKVFEHAFAEACTRVRERTELPLLVGLPEA